MPNGLSNPLNKWWTADWTACFIQVDFLKDNEKTSLIF